jgi:transposase-like protein
MDTSGEAAVDSLGRRTGPRRHYTFEQKREIIEATRVPGASVASVSRAHGINHNVVFGWRRLYDQGLLAEDKRAVRPRLLPVRIETPTIVAASDPPRESECRAALCAVVELQLSQGERLRFEGPFDREALAVLIETVRRRP